MTIDLTWLCLNDPILSDRSADKYYLTTAYEISRSSPDPYTKNGAIIVDEYENTVIGRGINQMPGDNFVPCRCSTLSRSCDVMDRNLKNEYIIHAEEAAIIDAAVHGHKLGQGKMVLYAPFLCCFRCARMIVQAGIKEVVGHAPLMTMAKQHTAWLDSTKRGLELLQEAGINCVFYKSLVGTTTLFNGKQITV